MNYQDDAVGLTQLLGKLEQIPGTFPPVYMAGGVLIGYDKLGRIKIMGTFKREPDQPKWLNWAVKLLAGSFTRAVGH